MNPATVLTASAIDSGERHAAAGPFGGPPAAAAGIPCLAHWEERSVWETTNGHVCFFSLLRHTVPTAA